MKWNSYIFEEFYFVHSTKMHCLMLLTIAKLNSLPQILVAVTPGTLLGARA